MPNLTISDLLKAQTSDDIFSALLGIASSLGLPTTAWGSGAWVRLIIDAASVKLSDASKVIPAITSGGFLDLAAKVTPEGGPGWLDLLCAGYGVPRIGSKYAQTDLVLTCSGASGATFQPGGLHFANGKNTYTNTAPVTIVANGIVLCPVIADVAGASSTAGSGAINALVTSLVGVTCSNPVAALGADAERNVDLVRRTRAKFQSLSDKGPGGAYDYSARTINDIDQVQVSSGPLTQPALPVTRTNQVTIAGKVTTYVASDAGAYLTPPNYTNQTSLAIVSSTNASPIEVTITGHPYATGDTIQIKDHTVNTNANGSWPIVVTGANTFTLDGSTGNGVGGATGSAYRYSDLDLIDKSVQANARPGAVIAETLSATPAILAIVGTIKVTGAMSSLSDTQITSVADDAVFALAKSVPIGGVGSTTLVELETIRGTVFASLGGFDAGCVSVALSSPLVDLVVPANGVPTVSPAPTWTVVRV